MSDASASLATTLADRYTIERLLGQGGMATVHLAEERKHKRKVAIKVLKQEFAASVGSERFLREIGIAHVGLRTQGESPGRARDRRASRGVRGARGIGATVGRQSAHYGAAHVH